MSYATVFGAIILIFAGEVVQCKCLFKHVNNIYNNILKTGSAMFSIVLCNVFANLLRWFRLLFAIFEENRWNVLLMLKLLPLNVIQVKSDAIPLPSGNAPAASAYRFRNAAMVIRTATIKVTKASRNASRFGAPIQNQNFVARTAHAWTRAPNAMASKVRFEWKNLKRHVFGEQVKI